MKGRAFRVACAYDTETTNLRQGDEPGDVIAFPVLFIANDLRACDLRRYKPGDGEIRFFRTAEEFMAYLSDLIAWGNEVGCIPVVAAYNLYFDLFPLLAYLNSAYELSVSAQSSTHVYTLDILGEDGKPALRFWDTYYLEMRGLAAMGDTCGLPKATGDWDYRLVRAPQTKLTEDELFYAGRDTEVIPAYIRYLLESNPWMQVDMLGCNVLTKTSLVRQLGKRETGRLKVKGPNGERSVYQMMVALCDSELPRDYGTYALRKSCFRGGFTFTAARYSGRVVENSYSLDVTSMHHAFINGMLVPVRFRAVSPHVLDCMLRNVCETPIEKVLANYKNPWGVAFHARVRYENIRLKKGSAFEHLGIATLAEGKFKSDGQKGEWGGESDILAETEVRAHGFGDVARNAVFAFSKLMSAEWCEVNVSEVEAYLISMVYDYDSANCIYGEASASFVKPPDYVALLSNLLFERKQAMKHITKTYHEGSPYTEEIPDVIPQGIADRLRDGSMTRGDVEGYYSSTVKGQFNSIYGMEAQDVFKPSFKIAYDGNVVVDDTTTVTPENYAEHYANAKGKTVLYTYGMRIVGRSRLHLAMAIKLLGDAYGDRAVITGGDTDSMKVACSDGIGPDELMRALEPLHRAVTQSIHECMARIRRNFPTYASTLDGVGTFDVEGAPYVEHMDAWNKARVSWDGEHAHITCAGLSRPKGSYTIEYWIDDMVAKRGYPFRLLAPIVLGWNTEVSNGVCHALERTHPDIGERYKGTIVDYRADRFSVDAPQSIALYDSDRILGDKSKGSNERSVKWLRANGLDPHSGHYRIDVRDGWPVLLKEDIEGWLEI